MVSPGTPDSSPVSAFACSARHCVRGSSTPKAPHRPAVATRIKQQKKHSHRSTLHFTASLSSLPSAPQKPLHTSATALTEPTPAGPPLATSALATPAQQAAGNPTSVTNPSPPPACQGSPMLISPGDAQQPPAYAHNLRTGGRLSACAIQPRTPALDAVTALAGTSELAKDGVQAQLDSAGNVDTEPDARDVATAGCASGQQSGASLTGSSDPQGNATDCQAKLASLQWIREGYRAALRAVNEGLSPSTSAPSAPLLQEGSGEARHTGRVDAARHGLINTKPQPSRRAPAAVKPVAASHFPRQPSRTAAEAEQMWAGFSRQHDAIAFAAACNSCLPPVNPVCAQLHHRPIAGRVVCMQALLLRAGSVQAAGSTADQSLILCRCSVGESDPVQQGMLGGAESRPCLMSRRQALLGLQDRQPTGNSSGGDRPCAPASPRPQQGQAPLLSGPPPIVKVTAALFPCSMQAAAKACCNATDVAVEDIRDIHAALSAALRS